LLLPEELQDSGGCRNGAAEIAIVGDAPMLFGTARAAAADQTDASDMALAAAGSCGHQPGCNAGV
jgi:hypothetical protein